MRKLLTLVYKDFLILVRDKAGLALLYLMPLALVALMAYLQNDTFKAILDNKMALVVLDQDHDNVGASVVESLEQSGLFTITRADSTATPETVETDVAKGNFQLGIVIPASTTDNIRNGIGKSVQYTFSPEGEQPQAQTVHLTIFVDPTTKNSFLASLTSTMREQMASVQTQILLKEVSQQIQAMSPMPIGDVVLPEKLIELDERTARMDASRLIPNAVQHNVPAWGMFAVFFIVVSLASNIIREREEGSYTRLRTMPMPYSYYLFSKVIVYLVICMTQIALMGLMGKVVLPMLGLPSLSFGNSWIGLLAVSLSASLAAIGYGIAIGQVAKTAQQASIFGSISVVILSALGGIWIPMFVMPHAMQIVCRLSPLNWGLTGYYNLLLRGGGLTSVLPQCATLLLFAGVCVASAIAYDKWKREDI
ncbi:MAG: ABC transporter permease [Paludibacteraceae bacterium]|nr:ABC transporter permease [Paludibacteraceae bacterium]